MHTLKGRGIAALCSWHLMSFASTATWWTAKNSVYSIAKNVISYASFSFSDVLVSWSIGKVRLCCFFCCCTGRNVQNFKALVLASVSSRRSFFCELHVQNNSIMISILQKQKKTCSPELTGKLCVRSRLDFGTDISCNHFLVTSKHNEQKSLSRNASESNFHHGSTTAGRFLNVP